MYKYIINNLSTNVYGQHFKFLHFIDGIKSTETPDVAKLRASLHCLTLHLEEGIYLAHHIYPRYESLQLIKLNTL